MTRTGASALSFSVIVASRNRASWLERCLTAIRQLDHTAFEVIVVADSESLDAVETRHAKAVPCDEPNLSIARNLGVAVAAGDICAFIDDDAVPEPLWLRHLEAAFRSTGATAATGYVRGRNGISFQSRTNSVDAEAETHDEPFVGWEPSVPQLGRGRALKLVGTNMAVRSRALRQLGGFDERLRFYLEDADLSMRLARTGEPLATVPLAQVHHGYAPSSRRTRLRAPLDLSDIGRSTAIYLRKYMGRADGEIFERIVHRERARLLRHMVAGTIEPAQVGLCLNQLHAGWRAGVTVSLEDDGAGETVSDVPAFLAHPHLVSGHRVLASPFRVRRRALLRSAQAIVEAGGRASVFSFSLTPFRHHVRYLVTGVWLQTGGVLGRSDREAAIVRWCRFAQRLRSEIRRVAKTRGIVETDKGKRWDQLRSSRREFESEDTR